ncbi:hypothetical protein [Streptococcus gordonii]|uniref:DUF3899 domain-containing protein n=1 Tax=Streptococcus gordonii TaxID=1302 RepID=A0AB35FRM4_STRGN|nr:hypothetical protein [Streptococcus gordonii]MBZ2127019.1 hypothetical protein [Streptococcus gordonii]MBZ2129313.1 hypothetical protein [Streptococcus gordonii]
MKETKSKHIDIIQSTISRMAQNSFIVKGWAVTILIGLFVFLQKNESKSDLFIYITPILFFWVLDSYYLWQERLFRKLYNKIIDDLTSESDLSMDTSTFKENYSFFRTLFSVSELLSYGVLLVLVILLLKTT